MVGDDAVVGLLGDRSQVHEVDHPGSLLPAELLVLLVVPYLRVDAFEAVLAPQVPEHLVEALPREVAVAVRPLDEVVGLLGPPLAVEAHPNDGLREDVEAVLRYADPVDVPAVGGSAQHRAFHQIVRVEHEETAFGHLPEAVTAPSDPLQALGHGLGRTDLTDQVHRSDVDPQLQGCRGHDALDLAVLEPLLHVEPYLLAQGAVVDLDALEAPLLELVDDALGSGPRVGEHQSGLVLVDEVLQHVVHHRIDDVRREGGHVRGGTDDLQIELLLRARFYESDVAAGSVGVASDQIGGDRLNGSEGRGQPDADEIVLAMVPEPLQREG